MKIRPLITVFCHAGGQAEIRDEAGSRFCNFAKASQNCLRVMNILCTQFELQAALDNELY
jgi:hypothetical protein